MTGNVDGSRRTGGMNGEVSKGFQISSWNSEIVLPVLTMTLNWSVESLAGMKIRLYKCPKVKKDINH